MRTGLTMRDRLYQKILHIKHDHRESSINKVMTQLLALGVEIYQQLPSHQRKMIIETDFRKDKIAAKSLHLPGAKLNEMIAFRVPSGFRESLGKPGTRSQIIRSRILRECPEA